MLTTSSLYNANPLRDIITKAYRMDETECLNKLLPLAILPPDNLNHITEVATQLVIGIREYKRKQSKMESLLHQYDLSTEEGIALMCLSEALLRIPDKATMDKFISDKISTVEWRNHLSSTNSLFLNAATWSLLISGKIYAPTLENGTNLANSLTRAINRLGVSVIRPIILQMMKALGNQFVLGQHIEAALNRAQTLEDKGYLFSYDMLGEAARTAADAEHYYDAYLNAIHAIGKRIKGNDTSKNPGISIKLSALHPRYEFTQQERVLNELPPRLLALALEAKKYNMGLTVDAEEADRLDLSLDIFAKVFADPALAGWDGFGLAVQAYQKRALYVIDWLAELSKQHGKRIFVRLVKGAYWDSEIKISQILGLKGYPVFTRKHATDTSYIACANKLLSLPDCFYPQFGTHNAYSVAAILEMARNHQNEAFEFQCLQGMGRPLYDQVVAKNKFAQCCRIYAPVGTHQDLLGYLVRRLLENGANSSFVNLIANDETPIEKIVADPVAHIVSLTNKPHPRIPLPKDIYGAWKNSPGIDLSNRAELLALKKQMEDAENVQWIAGSIINGRVDFDADAVAISSPSNTSQCIGYVKEAHQNLVEEVLDTAEKAKKSWSETTVSQRANLLERAAEALEAEMPNLIYIIMREGGRSIPDAIAEIREAIDYCRYYAYRAELDLKPINLPSVTGETNQLRLYPRGVIACISPWNFPVAIYAGQIVAALVTGNVVVAKPAEQTPLTAFKVIDILHSAGIPKNVLQLLIGSGEVIGAKLVADSRIDGVIFTGSTATAQHIAKSLANRSGPIVPLIAETGGQNAMIVDSSALPEQTVLDIAQSAFNSAGQRCSALRVLFVQEEIAPKFLNMLKGYMAELNVGDPALIATDVGPVIDRDALQMLKNHFEKMSYDAKLIAQAPLAQAANGYFFAPCAFELTDLRPLESEVFGPILHVVKYPARQLDKVIEAVINTGYGLTLGIHSRIDATIQYIATRMPIGNIYVNRNMIGAVVGVQPFGGEGLSGTGPKAGGPYYLPRLCVERAISTNTTAVGGNASLVSLLDEDISDSD